MVKEVLVKQFHVFHEGKVGYFNIQGILFREKAGFLKIISHYLITNFNFKKLLLQLLIAHKNLRL